MLQRVKEVQESDLRMVGALARNIQRVLAVTQADIDAAAAQGKSWLVKRVVKVNDPLDNLRGGTQLVIKQNSIQPGQNVMRVLYSGNSKTVGPAVAPLSLPGAAADDILSLIAFGGTQQEGVPQEYTRLDRLQGDGNAYIDLGITLNQDDEIEVDFIFKYAAGSQIFGYRDSASSKNITLFSGGGAGSLFMDFNNSDYTNYRLGTTGTDDAQYTAKISKAKRALYSGTTEIVANNTACPDTFTTGNALLFFAGGNPSGTARFTGSILGVRIKDRMNLVPAKRNSDDVLGMYDMITGQFFTNAAGSGAFIAGDPMVPTPAYPVDIVCNNGVLKARHQSGLPLGYTLLEYIGGTGTQYIETDTKIASTDIIETEFQNSSATGYGALYGIYNTGESSAFYANQTYYGYDAVNNKVNTNVSVDTDWHTAVHNFVAGTLTLDGNATSFTPFEYTNTANNGILARYYNGSYGYFFKGNIRKFKIVRNGVVINNMVPAKDSTNTPGLYDLITGDFWTNSGTGDLVAGNPVSDPVEVYTAGPIETIAIKDDQNTTVSTATCEDLLSVGTYTDEQEVVSGVVTRKVGIKVLDGTENWSQTDSYSNPWVFYTTFSDGKSGSGTLEKVYCTHFQGVAETNPNMPPESAKITVQGASPTISRFYVKTAAASTIELWKAYLAAQYAAGTPVIVIYPLATPTTNTVTPQPMQTAAGDNTAEITQAGMAGLELEVEYVEA